MVRSSYALVLAGATCCYAALGAVVRVVPTLGGSALTVGVAIGAPALTAVAARPAGGRLADKHGPQRVAVAGAVVTAIAALPLFLPGANALLSSRLLTGLGEGAMMSASVLWLLRLAGPQRRGRALGHIGLANYAGLTAGPLVVDAVGGIADPTRAFAAAAALPLCAAGVLSRAAPAPAPSPDAAAPSSLRRLVRLTTPAGAGLLLVNVGYAALLAFGAKAAGADGSLVLPAYALTVIVVRTFAGSAPDRFGGRVTLTGAASAAALGLLVVALAPTPGAALAAVVVVGAGQALAVPALGLLALAPVPAVEHGAASGLFFAWFDAGVGLGGPLVGLAGGIAGPDAGLACAAVAVAAAVPAAIYRTSRSRV
jgi:MFS family permease